MLPTWLQHTLIQIFIRIKPVKSVKSIQLIQVLLLSNQPDIVVSWNQLFNDNQNNTKIVQKQDLHNEVTADKALLHHFLYETA